MIGVLVSRLSMLMQRKLVLYSYCTPVFLYFLFQPCLKFFSFQTGGPRTPSWTPAGYAHVTSLSLSSSKLPKVPQTIKAYVAQIVTNSTILRRCHFVIYFAQ